MFNIDYNWYSMLIKSSLTPSAGSFKIIWVLIYFTVIASFIFFVWNGIRKEKAWGILTFLIQLTLNFLWTPIFFITHDVKLAFIIILLLTISLILNIFLFWKHSKISAILLIPYLIWIIFAGYLNFIILKSN